MRALRWSLVLLLLLCIFAPARRGVAQPAKPDYEAAKRHYQAAEKAAAASDWSTAAKEYGVAYDITRDAVLFFKLGNAYQQSGDCTRAVEYYQRYLAEAKPSEEFQKDTASRIETCKKAPVAADGDDADTADAQAEETSEEETDGEDTEEETAASDDDAPSAADSLLGKGDAGPSFVETETTWQRTAAWTSVGFAVAFATAGAVLGLSAKSREEDIDNLLTFRDTMGRPVSFDDSTQERYDDLVDEGERLDSLAMVSFGMAGAATVAAVVFFVIDPQSVQDESDKSAKLAPTLTPNHVGLTAHWSF